MMRWLLKISAGLLGLYILFWACLALYFSYAGQHKEILEANLTSLFKRDVSIEQLRTAWRGISPVVQIHGFKVAGDSAELPALAFTTMSAQLEPLSILRLWPKLTEFAVEAPLLEVVSLPDNRLQVAGIPLSANRTSGISPKRLISWLMNHQSITWHDGEVVWRRPSGALQRYSDVSFVYERQHENRTLNAATVTAKGALAISAEANGNMLYNRDWNASLEVLGDHGQRLLSSDDLSLVVERGRGRAQLKSLSVERVRDFLQLTGLSEAASWVMDSQLDGVLNNVQFDFAGPFLQFDEWSLNASASDVSFLPTPDLPGMNHLSGSIEATRAGGTFEFASDNASFRWPKLFAENFPIEQAEGRFRWDIGADGIIDVHLEEALFDDGNLQIESIDAHCRINTRARKVGVLADWFTAGPIEDLRFEDGQIVSRAESGGLFLRAKAKLAIEDMANTARYLPTDPRVAKLRTWWQNAFAAGRVPTAELNFEGPLSLGALRDGSTQILGIANFEGVALDYGYQRQWPILNKASGSLELTNNALTITPEQAWVEQDQLENGTAVIEPIFDKGRVLSLSGSMRTSLKTVADFLFSGPLLSLEQRELQASEPFPVQAEDGIVNADVSVVIPLTKVSDTTVEGTATVSKGRLVLPQGVALDNISTNMSFSERSASADKITAEFLGGDITAKLVTTEAAQPPKFKIEGSGRGQVGELEPWIGEHLLSWFDGPTDWQGEVGIDGAAVTIDVQSDLQGVAVTAPAPLAKAPNEASQLLFAMRTGGSNVTPELVLDYGQHLRLHMSGEADKTNTLIDRARLVVADQARAVPKIMPPGVNFVIDLPELDLDTWLSSIIELASLETKPLGEGEEPNTAFLDAMRSAKIRSPQTKFLGRPFGRIDAAVASTDGTDWIGTLMGDHLDGTLRASPRAADPSYKLNLAYFHMVEAAQDLSPPDPVDSTLQPSQYPAVELNATTFVLAGKTLGRLSLSGETQGDVWRLGEFSLNNTDIRTTGEGEWRNSSETGSQTTFSLLTKVDEAGGVLDEMQFNDLVRQGAGELKGNLRWIGAPHEFDFARLNGDFDLQLRDGELVQVESGAGRLIGLLNFNSILRRLTLDFRDVFSSGLKFDKMQYTGILAEGKAIMREAFMLSPAVFVQMEGNIDLNREEIDMEIHASPELGGNLALLSAIANPTAGAVVFLTQRIFKDQMRSNSFLSYRAEGTWEDFELAEINDDGEPISNSSQKQPKGAGE